MLGWLLVSPVLVPAGLLLAREIVSEVVFAIWMRCHDEPICELLPREDPVRALPRGMVVDGELV